MTFHVISSRKGNNKLDIWEPDRIKRLENH